MAGYVVSVGMEVHAELLTQSKMFCRCEAAFGGEPNTRVCPICLGMPGTLPAPNRMAIEFVLRTALALNCTIARDSIFHRKNYFYPDLPKGYQVSQYGDTNPIGYDGHLNIAKADGSIKKIKIRRVHLEEDTGKLMHLPSGGSGIDFNRAGVPLMEIVTDFPPDIESGDDARDYLSQLRQILIYIGVCNGKLEQGSMRCEPNISIRPEGSSEYGTKTELKNLNSIRSVEMGIEFERRRQQALIESGGKVLQETRGWNEATETSFAMRVKEAENDYRYFPCPDLMPMHFSEEMIERVKSDLPELPMAKQLRYQKEFGLTSYDAGVLAADREWALFYEQAVSGGADPKEVCNAMSSDFVKLLNESGQTVGSDPEREKTKVTPAHIAELAQLRTDGTISSKIGKQVMSEMFVSGEMPSQVTERLGLVMISDDSAISSAVLEVLAENTEAVLNYRNGKTNVLGFLVGQVMRKTGGKANPPMVQEAVRRELEK